MPDQTSNARCNGQTVAKALLLTCLGLPVLASGARAQGAASGPELPDFAEAPPQLASHKAGGGAGSSNNSGVEEVVLLGNPDRKGIYVILLKVAPDTSIAAHHHAGQRVGTVLTGTWALGYGDRFDAGALRTLPPGSIYTEPAGHGHFARTGAEAVVVQITGYGPTSTTYENPADDPSRKQK